LDFGYPVLTSLIVFPLVAAAGLFLIKSPQVARAYTLGASILELILGLPLLSFQFNADFQFVEKAHWVPQWGLEYALGVDGQYLMVLLTLAILPLCVMCSWTYISKRVKEFHFCLLFMTSACVGVFAALDFVLFYVFWEAMSSPCTCSSRSGAATSAVTHRSSSSCFTLAGSTLLLAAPSWPSHHRGHLLHPRADAGELQLPAFQCWGVFGHGAGVRHQGGPCSPSIPGCLPRTCRRPARAR
jgi:NADH-quinone oxidoreductase subunit M